MPDKHHDVIARSASPVEKFFSFSQYSTILLFVKHFPEVVFRSVSLEVNVFDVLPVRLVQRNRGGLHKIRFAILRYLVQ